MHTVETSPQIHPLTPSAWLPLISRDSDPRLPPTTRDSHLTELDELRAEVESALSEATEPPGLKELRSAVDGVLATVLEPPRDETRARATALESCLAGIAGDDWLHLATSSGLL